MELFIACPCLQKAHDGNPLCKPDCFHEGGKTCIWCGTTGIAVAKLEPKGA